MQEEIRNNPILICFSPSLDAEVEETGVQAREVFADAPKYGGKGASCLRQTQVTYSAVPQCKGEFLQSFHLLFHFCPLSTGSTRRIHSSYAYGPLFDFASRDCVDTFGCQALVKKRIKYGLRDRRGVLCQCYPRLIKLAEPMILVTL